MSKQPFAMVLYALAALCLLVPLFAGLLLALNNGQIPTEVFLRYLPAAACVWAGLLAFGMLVGVGSLMDREPSMPRKLQTMLTEIHTTLQAVGRTVSEAQPAASEAPGAPAAAPLATTTSTPVAAFDPAVLHKLESLLAEIRDAGLMNESQKQKRLLQVTTSRRRVAMAKVEEMIATSRWHEAEALLANAEQEFVEDAVVQAMRRRYEESKETAERQALGRAKQAIQDQIALSSWDRASEIATAFAQQHPGAAADELVQRVAQLRRDYTDSIGSELYDEVRANVEQRSWRRAYDAAKRLLAKCPDHPKAPQIKNQLAILKDNAETEQRNALEARIQDMIRAKRYNEAIELAQELQNTYPNSHQAEIAGQLIARLQQHLATQEATDAA